MVSAETQVALENLGAFARNRVLVVGFGGDELPRALRAAGSTSVIVLNSDLRAHRASEGARGDGVDLVLAPWLESVDAFDAVLLRMPKETERLRMQLAMARAQAASGGVVGLVGRNDEGGRSAGRHLGELVGEPAVLDYRHHCRAYRADAGGRTTAFRPEEWLRVLETEAAGRALALCSYPGVFSHGRLDAGTALLLSVLDLPPKARALDVGCGSGAIAAWLGVAGITADAIDVDVTAVRATEETFGRNRVTGARAWASDVFSDVPKTYTHVITNAPFHTGVRTTSETAQRLIHEAPARLERGGEFWMVANRFLPYGPVIGTAFASVEIVAEDGRYRVWRARRA